ncbi:MAG: 4Fe-4S dicluster domain-containing protein [Gammaproteobacteria bacterium]|nr:4Fe-4S dicluster domain-containing protein [Gammaproteobacteria bacterium]
MDTSETTLTYRRLGPDAPVGLLAGACLELHPRGVTCARCLEACPMEVLHLTEKGMELGDGCLGCGRCMAVCPTGAIAVHGFSLALTPESTMQSLVIDCWKVPGIHSPPGAVRVPCLGGLSVSQLLALRYVAGSRELALLDRGLCGKCEAGGGDAHPAATVLSAARAWLDEIGAPATHWPTLMENPLPDSSQRPRISDDAEPGTSVSRCDFESRLAREVSTTASEVTGFHLKDNRKGKPVRAVKNPAPVRAVERERQRLILDRLAARYGGSLPDSFFPTVEIGPECRGHKLCASLCPTGALHHRENPHGGGVAFESAGCIACGQCERSCPEHALRLSIRAASARPQDKSMEQIRNVRDTCMDCDGSCTPDGRATR